MQKFVTLVVVPGPGASSVETNSDTTLAQFAADNNLNGRALIIDGEQVDAADWSSTTVGDATEIFATGAVKGNCGRLW